MKIYFLCQASAEYLLFIEDKGVVHISISACGKFAYIDNKRFTLQKNKKIGNNFFDINPLTIKGLTFYPKKCFVLLLDDPQAPYINYSWRGFNA